MGWRQLIVTAGTVIIGGTAPHSGLFVYSGTPAAGNPPIFAVVAPGTTTDPFGNPVNAIMNVGNLSAAHAGWDANGIEYLADSTGTTQIVLNPGKRLIEFFPAAGTGSAPLITISPSGDTDQFGHTFQAGITTYQAGTTAFAELLNQALVLQDSSSQKWTVAADVLGPSLQVATPASNALYITNAGFVNAALPGNSGSLESWHTMSGFSNSWAATGNTPRYRMGSENRVWFDGAIDATSATAGAFFTVPALYQPVAPTKLWAGGANGGVIAGQVPFVAVTSTGVASISGVTLPTAGAHISITGSYPLD
jgi:hypothetical protein